MPRRPYLRAQFREALYIATKFAGELIGECRDGDVEAACIGELSFSLGTG
jgi:hypothetical protein